MRRKNFVKIISTLIVSAFLFGAVGCGQEIVDEDPKTAYLKTLESGNFYIRHNTNYTVEKPYFGEATFSVGTMHEKQTDEAVMWFHGDEDKIPILYEGDSLIYYTTNPLKEEYTLERYEVLPYSVGLCKMTVSPSGRFKVLTDENEKCTYPHSDTDQILNFVNSEVIIDTLGGIKLRAAKEDITFDENGNVVKVSTSALTRGGTIAGLEAGKTYSCEVYEGTVGTQFDFTADVLPIVHWESYTSVDYDFESLTIMNIPIPEDFHSGYYMINGVGVFKYVKLSEELSEYDLQELGASTVEEYQKTCELTMTLPTIDIEKIDYNKPNPSLETEFEIELEKPEDEDADSYGIDYASLMEQLAKLIAPDEEKPQEIQYDEEGNRIEAMEYYIPKIADINVESNSVYELKLTFSDFDFMHVEKLMVSLGFPETGLQMYVTKALATNNSLIIKLPVPENLGGLCRVTVYNSKYNYSVEQTLVTKRELVPGMSTEIGNKPAFDDEIDAPTEDNTSTDNDIPVRLPDSNEEEAITDAE